MSTTFSEYLKTIARPAGYGGNDVKAASYSTGHIHPTRSVLPASGKRPPPVQFRNDDGTLFKWSEGKRDVGSSAYTAQSLGKTDETRDYRGLVVKVHKGEHREASDGSVLRVNVVQNFIAEPKYFEDVLVLCQNSAFHSYHPQEILGPLSGAMGWWAVLNIHRTAPGLISYEDYDTSECWSEGLSHGKEVAAKKHEYEALAVALALQYRQVGGRITKENLCFELRRFTEMCSILEGLESNEAMLIEYLNLASGLLDHMSALAVYLPMCESHNDTRYYDYQYIEPTKVTADAQVEVLNKKIIAGFGAECNVNIAVEHAYANNCAILLPTALLEAAARPGAMDTVALGMRAHPDAPGLFSHEPFGLTPMSSQLRDMSVGMSSVVGIAEAYLEDVAGAKFDGYASRSGVDQEMVEVHSLASARGRGQDDPAWLSLLTFMSLRADINERSVGTEDCRVVNRGDLFDAYRRRYRAYENWCVRAGKVAEDPLSEDEIIGFSITNTREGCMWQRSGYRVVVVDGVPILDTPSNTPSPASSPGYDSN